ncbi:MAG: hypothetical protein ABIJ09_12970 [Pseudomonadota bacterium]
MKKFVTLALAAVLSMALFACNTVHSANVEAGDVVANGTPVAVVNANSVGLTLILHIIPIIDGGNLDTVVNKTLVAEAKAAGGNRVQIVDAMSMPRSGIFMLTGSVVGFPLAFASGIAVK